MTAMFKDKNKPKKDDPRKDKQIARPDERGRDADEHGLSTIRLEESDFGALTRSPSEIAGIIRTNIGPAGISMGNLTRVKVPSGESYAWTVNGIRGPQMHETIEGIIIHQRDARAYWKKSIDEGGSGQPPDCMSEDMYNGKGNPGGPCAECTYNEWGSAIGKDGKDARGKACKEVKILYVLPKGKAFLPYVFILPPTSLKAATNYLLGLASEAMYAEQVVTGLSLKESQNADGVKHAVVEFKLGKELSEAEVEVVRAYVKAIKPALDRRPDGEFNQAEVDGGGDAVVE